MEDIEPSLPRYIIDYRWYWKLFIAEKSYYEEFAEKSGHKRLQQIEVVHFWDRQLNSHGPLEIL